MAEAKARLSAVLRDAAVAPVVIHSRGRDVGVLIDPATYGRLDTDGAPLSGGAAFLSALGAVRERFGEGVDDFEPAKAAIAPVDPFGPAPRRR